MDIQLNSDGLKQAREFVRAHKYDWYSDWTPPTEAKEEEFIKATGTNLKAYSKWFLGVNRAQKKGKDKYEYIYGDFEKVYLSALLDIEDKVRQDAKSDKDAAEILDAVQELRELIYADLMQGAQKVYKQLKQGGLSGGCNGCCDCY
jgi:hypothetical protein